LEHTGAFTPVPAKHTKNLGLVDILAVGVDRMQRNFEPMRKPVEAWKGARLPDESAKLVIYRAFVEGELDVLKHLARRVHELTLISRLGSSPADGLESFQCVHGAFKGLDPIPQSRATANLGGISRKRSRGVSASVHPPWGREMRNSYAFPSLHHSEH
jgi:hypothetical protein